MSFISTPGDGRLAILKLVNNITGKTYSLNDVDFSVPTINTNPTYNRNTKLVVSFKSEKGYYGSKTIYYNRIHVSDLPTLTISRGSATTYHGVIAALNSTFNLHLTTSDITNGSLPDQVSSTITVTLPVSTGSYLYYDTSKITNNGFVPNYNIFKPTHTLLSFLCMGVDRYGEYSDNDGGVYRKLLLTNSYECGFEDGLPRIEFQTPGTMSALEEASSGTFTLTLANGVSSVSVNVNGNGLTLSQSSFTLTVGSPTATFTASSNTPGVYEIAITNTGSLINPASVYFNVIDKYATSYTVTPPLLTESFIGNQSGLFTVTGINVDPDEPVTVTIKTVTGITSSVPNVVLTAASPSATFSVNGSVANVYYVKFTNNRKLTNNPQIPFLVRPPIVLTLVPPVNPIIDEILSDLFTVTVANPVGDVTVTPNALNANTVSPPSFILNEANPSGSFRLLYNDVGSFNVNLTNDSGATNPAQYNFAVIPKPYITITLPSTSIYSGQSSDNFTVTLVNGYKNVSIDITTNARYVSTNKINLTPGNPTATFTMAELTSGNYYLDFTNSENYTMVDRLAIVVYSALQPRILLDEPLITSLKVGQSSSAYTLTLMDHPGPVEVYINTTIGLDVSTSMITLDAANPIGYFVATPTSSGGKTISITNNGNAANPSNKTVTVRVADFVQLTSVPSNIRVNTLSDNFVISLLNPFNPVVVTPVSPGATFTPTSLTLGVSNRTGSFRAIFPNSGSAIVNFQTSPETGSTIDSNITVLEAVQATLELTGPSGNVYTGDDSGNFTVRLINGQAPITVSIQSAANISTNSLALTPSNPIGTFTVNAALGGTYQISITNNGSLVNPSPVNHIVSADPATLTMTGPTINNTVSGTESGIFTVTAVGIVRPIVITPSAPGTNSFTPTTLTLTVSEPSKTFKINSNDVSTKLVTITNNRGIVNPTGVNYQFTQPLTPTIQITQNNGTNGAVGGTPLSFTITLLNPISNVFVQFTSWVGAGISKASTTLTVEQPTDTFTLTPTVAGNFNLNFTNGSGLANPSPINIVIATGPTLSFQRNGNGSIGVNTDETFTVTLVNGQADVEIIPYSDTDIVISGYMPPLILSVAQPSATFNAKSITSGNKSFSITNTSGLVNPSPINIDVLAGTLSLTGIQEYYSDNVVSSNLTLTMLGYTDPTIVTITLSNFVDGILTIEPARLHSQNQVLLTGANPSANFTIVKQSAGLVNISFTNNNGLTNPVSENVNVIDTSIISVLSPVIDTDFAGQTISNFKVLYPDIVDDVDITIKQDFEAEDPYWNNVVLDLNFQNALGTTIVDNSSTQTAVTAVGPVSIVSSVEGFGDKILSFPTPGGYLLINSNLENFKFYSGEFTIELDLISTETSGNKWILVFGKPGVSTPYFLVYHNSSGYLGVDISTGSFLGNVKVNTGELVNIVIAVTGTYISLHIDGDYSGGYSFPDAISFSGTEVTLGGMSSNISQSEYFIGKIASLKITKGVSRYGIPDFTVVRKKIINIIPEQLSLSTNNKVATFNSFSNDFGAFNLKFTNNNSLVNPPNKIITYVEKSIISIDNKSKNIIYNVPSEIFTITLEKPSLPVTLTFNLDAGLSFSQQPVGLVNNQLVLSSSNTTATFSVISSVNGTHTFEITNNKNLEVPLPIDFLSKFQTIVSLLTPPKTNLFLGTTGEQSVNVIGINEPITVYPFVDNLTDDQYIDNVSLLLDFVGPIDEINVVDRSIRKKPFITEGNLENKIYSWSNGTTVGKFNGSFAHTYIDGNLPDTNLQDFAFGSGDFTIEFEFNYRDYISGFSLINFIKYPTGSVVGNANGWEIGVTTNGRIYWNANTSFQVQTTTLGRNFDSMIYCFCRRNGILTVYVNGIAENSIADNYIYDGVPRYLSIGNSKNGVGSTNTSNGALNYIRITKGIARYSGNHEPFRIKKIITTPSKFIHLSDTDINTFTITPTMVGTFGIKIDNNLGYQFTNSNVFNFNVMPTVTLTLPSSKITNVDETSLVYRINLLNASTDAKIAINLPPNVSFVKTPDFISGNEITLNSVNNSSTFTLTSSVAGTYLIEIINLENLSNVISANHSFVLAGTDPLVINSNDLRLDLNKPDDTVTNLNLFQDII